MISILCPTRNRPKNMIRLVDSILSTTDNIQNIELVVYIDDDDEESIPALQYAAEKITTEAVQGNRLIGSQMYNELGKMAKGDIIMFAADDMTFNTKRWDTIVEDKFKEHEDGIMFVYGEDGFQNGRIGTHGFIHRHWMELLGYVLPPKLASSFTDEWITELSERVNRKYYMPELSMEHLHPAVGKAPQDKTYAERPEVQGNIQEFYNSLISDREKDAKKLQAFIDIFK